jgi:multidrug resistance efflux pump
VRIAAGVALALFLIAWIPVRLSVLAPAEIVPIHPLVVRSPADAVVGQVDVRPNQPVSQGQLLMTLDPARVQAQLDVSQKDLDVAQANYAEASQQAVTDLRARAELATLEGKIREAQAAVDYAKDVLGRLDIRAPRAGVALFDDPSDWIGRPVTLGQRLILIADPQDVQIEIMLPVDDMIPLRTGDPAQLFFNADPSHTVPARLDDIGYEATQTATNTVAYRLTAAPQAGQTGLRVGLRGTVRIEGDTTTLFYYVFRRPLGVIRQTLGF